MISLKLKRATILFALVAAACKEPTARVIAGCELEARRMYASAPDSYNAQMYIDACMRAKGFRFVDDPSKVKACDESADKMTEAACYRPVG